MSASVENRSISSAERRVKSCWSDWEGWSRLRRRTRTDPNGPDQSSRTQIQTRPERGQPSELSANQRLSSSSCRSPEPVRNRSRTGPEPVQNGSRSLLRPPR